MIQRALQMPHHLAVVMDGNGRWATRRGLPRAAGHAAGARAVRRLVEAAARRGIPVLTLYAFSGDNWNRPQAEVATLFRLFERFLDREQLRCVRNEIRLEVIGRRDRLPPTLLRAITRAERATRFGHAMTVRVALDYSARDTLARAAILAAEASTTNDGIRVAGARDRLRDAIAEAMHASAAPDVDLLLRTGGERRLSDFLLWECAYAELVFSDVLFPDMSAQLLDAALADFAGRERRFGALPLAPASPAAENVPSSPVPARAAARGARRATNAE
jgi:undecaprenyl diphosphate synthase